MLDGFFDLATIFRFTGSTHDEICNAQHHRLDCFKMRDNFVRPLRQVRFFCRVKRALNKPLGFLTPHIRKMGQVCGRGLHWHRQGFERHFGILVLRQLVP